MNGSDRRWLLAVFALLAVWAIVTTIVVASARPRTRAVQALRSTIELLQRDFEPSVGYRLDRDRLSAELGGVQIVADGRELGAGDEGRVAVTVADGGYSLLLATLEGASCHRQRRDMRPAPRDTFSTETVTAQRPCRVMDAPLEAVPRPTPVVSVPRPHR